MENDGKEYVVGSFFSEPRRERYYVIYPHTELTADEVAEHTDRELHKDTTFMRVSFVNPVTWFVSCFQNNSRNASKFFVYCDWDMKNVPAFIRYIADNKKVMAEEGENRTEFEVAHGQKGFHGFRYINAETILDTFKRFIIVSHEEKAAYVKGGDLNIKYIYRPGNAPGYLGIWTKRKDLHPKYHEEFLKCADCYDMGQRDR